MHRISFHLACILMAVAAIDVRAAESERARMLDNDSETSARDCVKTAAEAASNEDLDTFVDCFGAPFQSRVRRHAAVVFATHSVSLELIDSHLVEERGSKAEIAVKYRVRLSDETWEVVSLITLAKSDKDGVWRIIRERITSQVAIDRDGFPSGDGAIFQFGDASRPAAAGRRAGGGCANGRCGR